MTSHAVPMGSADFWKRHFERHGVEHSDIEERFGRRLVRVRHPAGMLFEMVEADSCLTPWVTNEIGADEAARGFFGAVMSVRSVEEQEQFLVEALGFRKLGVDGAYHRFETTGGGPGAVIDLHHEPSRPPGTWTFGAGTYHHIAFNVETDDALVAQKALYEELGYTDASEIKDRYYFHSMYVRSPGGILVECTASAPGGFYLDEAPEDLGRHSEPSALVRREAADIMSMLEPITVPESNRPRPGSVPVRVPLTPAAITPAGVPMTRTRGRIHHRQAVARLSRSALGSCNALHPIGECAAVAAMIRCDAHR